LGQSAEVRQINLDSTGFRALIRELILIFIINRKNDFGKKIEGERKPASKGRQGDPLDDGHSGQESAIEEPNASNACDKRCRRANREIRPQSTQLLIYQL
jgi:hypothetical protein